MDISINANVSTARLRTIPRTLYTDQYVQVSGSICSAMFVTYSPTVSSLTSSIPITRLYDGFPRPQDYLVSTKVAVVGGKIAYKLTRNYWTTKL
jgi:hypothetical protein